MKHAASLPRLILCLGIVAGLSMLAAVAHGQRPPEPLLGSGPFTYHTLVADFSVDVITKGLVHPWGMAFLPDGSILVTGGIWNGHALTKVHDIFVDDNVQDDSIGPINMGSDLRLVFGRDGKLYLGTGAPNAPANAGKYAHARGGRAQDPTSDGGKVLRLNDDGTIPKDNPFVGRPGYRPEIYTMGHRNMTGMAVNPFTGAIWEVENGP